MDFFEDFFREMRRRQRGLERFFDRPTLDLPLRRELTFYEKPATDLEETENEIIARFDLPGFNKEEIHLFVDENRLKLKAERKHEIKKEKKNYFAQERSYAGFYREFSLPVKVKPEEVSAEYKNGVLTVIMPKAVKEKKKEKVIQIK